MPKTTNLRAVVDTNVIIAAQANTEGSPAFEIYTRWQNDEFALLYSLDMLTEYVEKMLDLKVSRHSIKAFILTLQDVGEFVAITRFHEKKYPTDSDDVAFLLCATNGDATHVISYDRHLLDLNYQYEFTICRPVPFLKTLRALLKA